MTPMDFSTFGPYAPAVVGFLLVVLAGLGRWVYRDAVARGDRYAAVWSVGIVAAFLGSGLAVPAGVVVAVALLVGYRVTHRGSRRLARLRRERDGR